MNLKPSETMPQATRHWVDRPNTPLSSVDLNSVPGVSRHYETKTLMPGQPDVPQAEATAEDRTEDPPQHGLPDRTSAGPVAVGQTSGGWSHSGPA